MLRRRYLLEIVRMLPLVLGAAGAVGAAGAAGAVGCARSSGESTTTNVDRTPFRSPS